MNPDYVAMARLRFQPRKIRTLERRIERDREEIQRIESDLLYETQRINILRRRERTLTGRIERNTETVNRLRLENMQLRQKMAEVLA
jgi:hypothetical protein